jgi:hypothetical protein
MNSHTDIHTQNKNAWHSIDHPKMNHFYSRLQQVLNTTYPEHLEEGLVCFFYDAHNPHFICAMKTIGHFPAGHDLEEQEKVIKQVLEIFVKKTHRSEDNGRGSVRIDKNHIVGFGARKYDPLVIEAISVLYLICFDLYHHKSSDTKEESLSDDIFLESFNSRVDYIKNEFFPDNDKIIYLSQKIAAIW